MKNKYEFFIAGRARNKDNILRICNLFDKYNISYYCFLKNEDDWGYGNKNQTPEEKQQEFESLGLKSDIVVKLFQNDFQSMLAKHKIVEAARMHVHGIAIAALKGTTTRSLAAQAADEILNISGVTTSFVLFSDGDNVIISARSVGEANVQLILESLGGGGNAATAGAQIPGKSVSEVLVALQDAINQYYSE